MTPVQYNKNISLQFTPQELAEMFCSMDETEMALFFNHINDFVDAEWDNPFSMQAASVERSEKLKDGGRSIMKTIGEYSEKQPTP